jgi:hypothetical protein
MKRVLVPLVACLLFSEASAQEAAYVGRGPQDMPSLCAGLPFYDRVDAYYPRHARNRNAPGHAQIDCAFDDAGHVSTCTVLSEDPADEGFGGAALIMACAFSVSMRNGHALLSTRHLIPETTPVYERDGQRRIRVTVNFVLWHRTPGSITRNPGPF